jgi:predicted Zn-ribbon and HTH transcriptional regulator
MQDDYKNLPLDQRPEHCTKCGAEFYTDHFDYEPVCDECTKVSGDEGDRI